MSLARSFRFLQPFCPNLPLPLNCTKFGQLIISKIIKIIATRSRILKLQCTRFSGWLVLTPLPLCWCVWHVITGSLYISRPVCLASLHSRSYQCQLVRRVVALFSTDTDIVLDYFACALDYSFTDYYSCLRRVLERSFSSSLVCQYSLVCKRNS